MKDVIIIFTILVFIISGSIITCKFYQDTMDELNVKLDNLIDKIATDERKEESIKEIEDLWNEKENILIIFQDHDSIDDIEELLYECFHYYKINQVERLKLAKEKMISDMEDLVKREKMTLVNLF